jgi:hypothetical protein
MTSQYCVNCGKALEPSYLFCPACGTKLAGEAAEAERASGTAPEMAAGAVGAGPADASLPGLALLARFGKMIALLGFVLPWVTISCAGQTLASIDGVSLVTGNIRMRNPMTGAVERHSGSPEALVLLCLFAIGLGLLLSFILPRRKAAVAAIISCGSAVLFALIELYIRIPGELRTSMARGRPGRFDQPLDRSMERMIGINPGSGFWITVLALAAVIGLSIYILKRVPPDPPDAQPGQT